MAMKNCKTTLTSTKTISKNNSTARSLREEIPRVVYQDKVQDPEPINQFLEPADDHAC